MVISLLMWHFNYTLQFILLVKTDAYHSINQQLNRKKYVFLIDQNNKFFHKNKNHLWNNLFLHKNPLCQKWFGEKVICNQFQTNQLEFHQE